MRFKNVVLLMATICVALIAGVFFAFSIAVIPAFSGLGDVVYIQAMQAINKDIVNPLFGFCFVGAPVFLLLSTIVSLSKTLTLRSVLLCVACIIYLAGSLGITLFGNIPLNDQLASFTIPGSSVEQVALARKHFEASWNVWHHARTLASLLPLVLLIIVCLKGQFTYVINMATLKNSEA